MSRSDRAEVNHLGAKTATIGDVTLSTGTATLESVTVEDVSISSTIYKSVFLGLGDFSTLVTEGADLASIIASTGDLSSTYFLYAYAFDKDAGEVVTFNFAVPTDWVEGTAIIPYIVWGTTSSTGSTGGGASAQQYVTWTLGYQIINLDSTTTGTVGSVEDTIHAAASSSVLKIQTTNFTAISATYAEVDAICQGFLARDATASTDTLDADALLYGLSWRYYIDGLGSTSTISDK